MLLTCDSKFISRRDCLGLAAFLLTSNKPVRSHIYLFPNRAGSVALSVAACFSRMVMFPSRLDEIHIAYFHTPCLSVIHALQEEQLREVTRHYGISLDRDRLMSRCPKCNVSAFRLVAKEGVASRVPDKVFELVDEFYECGECLQVFWMVSADEKAQCLLTRIDFSFHCHTSICSLSSMHRGRSHTRLSA